MIRLRTLMFTLLALLVLGVLFTSQPVYAVGFTVTRTDDPVPDGCNPTDCSLREAVIAANIAAGPDTITLPAGTFTLSIAGQGEDASATGDLDIRDDTTINGVGAATAIQAGTTTANGIDRVVTILNNANVVIANMTIQHGTVTVYGGGIANDGGATLTLMNTTIRGNNANAAGAIFNNSDLIVINSTISGNTVNFTGGGMYNSGTLTMVNSTVSGNQANTDGGGITSDGTVTLINTTIANNRADSDGNGTGNGGGARFSGTNTTTLRNTLIGNNTTGADTTVPSDCSTTKPLISQGYNLIEDVTNCAITGDATGNITGKDPRLGNLGDNGGPTQTQALLPAFQTPTGTFPPINFPASPAIDAGNPAGCTAPNGVALTADQRGVARPQGARCDIGAFEREVVPPSNTVYVPLVGK